MDEDTGEMVREKLPFDEEEDARNLPLPPSVRSMSCTFRCKVFYVLICIYVFLCITSVFGAGV